MTKKTGGDITEAPESGQGGGAEKNPSREAETDSRSDDVTEAPESGPSGGGETSGQSDVDTGAALGSNKMLKDDKGDLAPNPDRIQEQLDKYRDEMAEDAPASSSREDNP